MTRLRNLAPRTRAGTRMPTDDYGRVGGAGAGEFGGSGEGTMTKQELNALAAEKIMGWWWGDDRHSKDSRYDCTLYAPDSPRYLDKFILAGPLQNPRYLAFLPDFASDPDASKRLRDKMRADGWKSCLFSTDTFTMRYWGYRKGQDTVEAHADTEELSCLIAALRAVGAISGEVEVTE